MQVYLVQVEIPDDAVNINANVVKILRKYPFKYRTNIPNFKEVHAILLQKNKKNAFLL